MFCFKFNQDSHKYIILYKIFHLKNVLYGGQIENKNKTPAEKEHNLVASVSMCANKDEHGTHYMVG